MKILILGHTGLLGSMVHKFLSSNYNVETTSYRWGSNKFMDFIDKSDHEWLINCIGCIPQKNPKIFDYYDMNVALPLFLKNHFSGKLINPATDCEFKGDIPTEDFYAKSTEPDASDPYGSSKKICSRLLAHNHQGRITQIRTSIIGPESSSGKSLWNWFVTNNDAVIKGFTNHYWNGVTTLQWAKIAEKIIVGDLVADDSSILQVGTDKISKYDILNKINANLRLNKTLIPVESDKYCNKCLLPDIHTGSLDTQILEADEFYRTQSHNDSNHRC